MKECSKALARRLGQPNFINKYFVGHGLDVGGKPDPLGLYVELFARLASVRTWDLEDGDAELLATVADDLRTAEDRAEVGEAVGQLKVGLARLKTLDRLTLEAFYLRGRSLKQMAREFDVPTGTIKRRLHVARQRLREVLEGIDPTLAERFAGDRAELCGV